MFTVEELREILPEIELSSEVFNSIEFKSSFHRCGYTGEPKDVIGFMEFPRNECLIVTSNALYGSWFKRSNINTYDYSKNIPFEDLIVVKVNFLNPAYIDLSYANQEHITILDTEEFRNYYLPILEKVAKKNNPMYTPHPKENFLTFTKEEVKSLMTSDYREPQQLKDKVIDNAIASYANDCQKGDIIGICDITVFQNGKNGFLLTDKALYSNEFSSLTNIKTNKIPLYGIVDVQIVGTKNHYLSITYQNDDVIIVYTISNEQNYVLPIIKKAIQLYASKQNELDTAIESLKAENNSADVSSETNEELQERTPELPEKFNQQKLIDEILLTANIDPTDMNISPKEETKDFISSEPAQILPETTDLKQEPTQTSLANQPSYHSCCFTKKEVKNMMPYDYVEPKFIKEKNIENAISNYAQDCIKDNIVGIRDVTVSGNGKKGFLLTNEALYSRDFSKLTKTKIDKVPLYGITNIQSSGAKDAFLTITYQNGDILTVYTGSVYRDHVLPILEKAMELFASKQNELNTSNESPSTVLSVSTIEDELQEEIPQVAQSDPEEIKDIRPLTLSKEESAILPKNQPLIPYQGKEPYIFISYSHRNTNEVFKVIDELQKQNFRVWYDEGIDPGTEWDETIASHVENCSYFIAMISKEYLASSNCKDELNYARDNEKQLLLVYLQDVELQSGMRMRLSRIQAIHKYKYINQDSFYDKLNHAQNIDSCLKND